MKMKTKVAFFYCNKGNVHLDCTDVLNNNPGLSGTAYMFYIISYLLTKRDNGISVTLFTTNKGIFSAEMDNRIVSDEHEAWKICDAEGFDYLVCKHSDALVRRKAMLCAGHKTKMVVWCHNFLKLSDLTFYSDCDNVARLITVGKEQLDVYRDHRAFYKSDYIYNCINPSIGVTGDSYATRKHYVTYMGAVIPGKGFHLLAEAWPKIIKDVPDAELFVIGNGKLYGDVKLGKWNLAEEKYERTFMRHITDADGDILPSVHLLGILGQEKYDVLAKTKIGVPSPTGQTETFCISALEMQLAGARIVAKKSAGYLDTVRDGVLVDKKRDLAKQIIRELKSTNGNHDEAVRYIKETFAPDVIAGQWEQLLLRCLPAGVRLHDCGRLTNVGFELKKYKERLRLIKEQFPFLYKITPPLDLFVEGRKKVGYKMRKIKNGLTTRFTRY